MASIRALLLLPPPPTPPTPSDLRGAFYDPIRHIIQSLNRSINDGAVSTTLHVALPYPETSPEQRSTRAQSFEATQRLVAGVYSLLAAIYDEESVGLVAAPLIDSRLVLFDDTKPSGGAVACVFDLRSLANPKQAWSHVYSVEGEPGETTYRRFRHLSDAQWTHECVKGGLAVHRPGRSQAVRRDSLAHHRSDDAVAHASVVAGGSFYDLHFTNRLLLTMALFLVEPRAEGQDGPRRVVLGVFRDGGSADALVAWRERCARVVGFLLDVLGPFAALAEGGSGGGSGGVMGRSVAARYKMAVPSLSLAIECVAISDWSELALLERDATAVVVSSEGGGDVRGMNVSREAKGWGSLQTLTTSMASLE